MLTRGQEISVEVDEHNTINVELRPGEMSLHHGRMFHASHANGSDSRRIGLAIRYISTGMAQIGGSAVARLVRGEDRYGHFELAPPPKGVLEPEDVQRMLRAEALQEAIAYRGAEQLGKRRA